MAILDEVKEQLARSKDSILYEVLELVRQFLKSNDVAAIIATPSQPRETQHARTASRSQSSRNGNPVRSVNVSSSSKEQLAVAILVLNSGLKIISQHAANASPSRLHLSNLSPNGQRGASVDDSGKRPAAQTLLQGLRTSVDACVISIDFLLNFHASQSSSKDVFTLEFTQSLTAAISLASKLCTLHCSREAIDRLKKVFRILGPHIQEKHRTQAARSRHPAQKRFEKQGCLAILSDILRCSVRQTVDPVAVQLLVECQTLALRLIATEEASPELEEYTKHLASSDLPPFYCLDVFKVHKDQKDFLIKKYRAFANGLKSVADQVAKRSDTSDPDFLQTCRFGVLKLRLWMIQARLAWMKLGNQAHSHNDEAIRPAVNFLRDYRLSSSVTSHKEVVWIQKAVRSFNSIGKTRSSLESEEQSRYSDLLSLEIGLLAIAVNEPALAKQALGADRAFYKSPKSNTFTLPDRLALTSFCLRVYPAELAESRQLETLASALRKSPAPALADLLGIIREMTLIIDTLQSFNLEGPLQESRFPMHRPVWSLITAQLNWCANVLRAIELRPESRINLEKSIRLPLITLAKQCIDSTIATLRSGILDSISDDVSEELQTCAAIISELERPDFQEHRTSQAGLSYLDKLRIKTFQNIWKIWSSGKPDLISSHLMFKLTDQLFKSLSREAKEVIKTPLVYYQIAQRLRNESCCLDAWKCLSVAMEASLGTLTSAAEKICHEPLRSSMESNNASILYSIAKAFCDLAAFGTLDWQKVILPDALVERPSIERWLWLEWILHILQNRNTRGDKLPSSDDARELVQAALVAYPFQEYPIRKLRIMTNALQLTAAYGDLEAAELLTQSTDCIALNVENLAEDSNLERFFDSNKLLLRMQVCLQTLRLQESAFVSSLRSFGQRVQASNHISNITDYVEDVEHLRTKLETFADLAGAHGSPILRLYALILVVHLGQSTLGFADQNVVAPVVRIAIESRRLGLSELATTYSSILANGIGSAEFSNLQLTLLMAVNRIDSAANVGQFHDGEEDVSRISYHVNQVLRSGSAKTIKSQDILAAVDALEIKARYLYSKGDSLESTMSLMKCSVLLQMLWKKIALSASSITATTNEKHDVEPLTTNFKGLEISRNTRSKVPTTPNVTSQPMFWSVISRLYSVLIELCARYQGFGLFEDTMNTLHLLERIEAKVVVPALEGTVLLHRGHCESWSKHFEDSAKHLISAEEKLREAPNTEYEILLQCFRGHSDGVQGLFESEHDAYAKAAASILKLKKVLEGSTSRVVEMAMALSPIPTSVLATIGEGNAKFHKHGQSDTVKKKQLRVEGVAIKGKDAASLAGSSGHGLPTIHFLHNDIIRRKTESYLLQNEPHSACITLKDIVDVTDVEQKIALKTVLGRVLMKRASSVAKFSAVAGIIDDSTIALPSVQRNFSEQKNLPSNHVDIDFETQFNNALQLALKEPKDEQPLDYLEPAWDLLYPHATNTSPPSMAKTTNDLFFTFVEIYFRLVQHQPNMGFGIDPRDVAACLDKIKSASTINDFVNILAAQAGKEGNTNESVATSNMYSRTSSVRDLSANLPHRWLVLSLTLSEDKKHIYITRYERSSDPFILRIPLTRQVAEDLEEEKFDVVDAIEELQNIIRSSDATIQKAKSSRDTMKTKAARDKWWSEREQLDLQLKDLLTNIENIWLGGFKGVLSPHIFKDTFHDAQQRFQTAALKSLASHLPSRNRVGRREQQCPVEFHPQIWKLFYGLAEASACIGGEGDDNDDSLSDLLYFVVDVLNLNGEVNAYDEIDFDAMTIEFDDALKEFQSAITDDVLSDIRGHHTILVLDKELHAIPWESLPCLEGRSISRVPCLANLEELIPTLDGPNHEQHMISATQGTYFLNTSNDLPKTQERFEAPLYDLTSKRGWSSIIAREPSEQEFLQALGAERLESQSLVRNVFLYIGHGSGSQYIRPRKIKQLRSKCNVALLFGCSSAVLKDAGEFDTFGTPKHYLAAGSPAVLGSLWDITDGDADLFASGVLEKWGLIKSRSFNEPCQKAKTKTKMSKLRGRRAGRTGGDCPEVDETGRLQRAPLSLSEAAAKSRGDCYLKYLNGAAMVVWGVPVFLAGNS